MFSIDVEADKNEIAKNRLFAKINELQHKNIFPFQMNSNVIMLPIFIGDFQGMKNDI